MIDMITVLVVIGILATIALSNAYRAKSAAYVAVMKSDLKALAIAQEVFYASAGGYFAEDPNSSSKGPKYTKNKRKLQFTPSPGVKIKIRGKQTGWSARAEHKRRKTEKFYCAIYVGDVKPYPPAEAEGTVTCEPRKRKKKKKKKKKRKK